MTEPQFGRKRRHPWIARPSSTATRGAVEVMEDERRRAWCQGDGVPSGEVKTTRA